MRHDETVELAQALQQCVMLLGAPLGILCSTIQDLCRCLVPLIKSNGLLSASMLEVAEEKEPTTSPSPAEQARFLVEESEPQKEQPTTIHVPNHHEEASEAKGVSSFGLMAIVQRQLPLTPPGFTEPMAVELEPPPLEDTDSP